VVAIGLGTSAFAETYVALVSRLVAKGHFEPQIEQLLLAKVNTYRRSRGVVALAPETDMAFAARAHAADIASQKRLGHVASNGMEFDSRMRALHNGTMVLPAMAENAAIAPAIGDANHIADVLFLAWLHSEGHRRTMVSRDYLKVSTGVTIADGKAYADQIFTGPTVTTNIMRSQ
ncbi:MAG: CAP domain-containing protein, partial [Aestuariivirga sp.]